MESADDLIAAVTDRQEVFESQPKEIIPAVALDEIIRVRVVAAGTFVGELGVAVDKRLGIIEIPHRDNRIHEKPIDIGHLQVPAHEKPHGRAFGTGDCARQQRSLLLRPPDHPIHVPHRIAEMLVIKGIGQAEGALHHLAVRVDPDPLAENRGCGDQPHKKKQMQHQNSTLLDNCSKFDG